MFNTKNAAVRLSDGEMDYIRFGTGKKNLIILPGLGDGLRTVKGTALPMAVMYRIFAKAYTVYAFSRKTDLPPDYSTRDMARDQAEAMDKLGIGKADVLGVSMGGMIAQYLAIDYPEKIGKLILTVTSARSNAVLEESVKEWIALAEKNDPAGFMDSNLRRIYSEDYYRKNKWMAPIVGKLTKPESYDRFFTQARACLNHNAFDKLAEIKMPTLVVGGEKDLCLGPEPSREIAAGIPGAKLKLYEQWGHGLYEEAGDFNALVLEFLTK